MKFYVASSWKNEKYLGVLEHLDHNNIGYYDFRSTNASFSWDELDTEWKTWDPKSMLSALNEQKSVEAFANDFNAMKECDGCILVHPCGRSAHLEAGWFVGQGKPVYVLINSGDPDLMLKMATYMSDDIEKIINEIRKV